MQIDNIEELINKTNITAFVHTSDIVAGKTYDVSKIDDRYLFFYTKIEKKIIMKMVK